MTSRRYEYKVLELREKLLGGKMSGDKLERILNEHAGEGWQLKAITSAEVKFGVSRAWDPEIGIGSPYLKQVIDAPEDYEGPYRTGDLPTIETPDAQTIVFHLKKPFPEFDAVVSQVNATPFPEGSGAGDELRAALDATSELFWQFSDDVEHTWFSHTSPAHTLAIPAWVDEELEVR